MHSVTSKLKFVFYLSDFIVFQDGSSGELAYSRRRGRDDEINYTLCLLCQTRTKKKLRCASEAGMSRIKQALNDRLKYNDMQNVLILDRLQTIDHDGDFSMIITTVLLPIRNI